MNKGCFGCSWPSNLGVMRMLNWFKRTTTPVPREQLVGNESEAQAERWARQFGIDEPVETWARQFGTNEPAAAGLTQMRVIVIASQKGDAAHLAVRAGTVGEGPAALVDTDPQGSLTEWWNARNDPAPALVTAKLDDLAPKLGELRGSGAAVAIIDTPPALTASMEQAIALADFVLIPARPSPHDLRAIGATVNIVRSAWKPFLFIINGAAPRANITAEAVAALSEHGRVAPIILFQRTDFAASMIDGRTVMDSSTRAVGTGNRGFVEARIRASNDACGSVGDRG
jgi:chromosome partitioning protein